MFKFLIIFFLLIAFVPTVRRFLFWLVVGRSMVNQQKDFQKKQTKKEGEINVDFVPSDKKGPDLKGGQYVDFEEVKD